MGTFEVLKGPRSGRIDVVGAGALLGDIAALTGTPRRPTIRALEPAVVRRIDRATFRQWIADDEQRLDDLTDLARLHIDRHAAISLVTGLLGVDQASSRAMCPTPATC